MKNFKPTCFLIALLLASISTAELVSQDYQTQKEVIIKKRKETQLRPRTADNVISCVYNNGELQFSFLFPEGDAQIVVSEPVINMTVSYTIDTAVYSIIDTGFINTGTTISITTEAGNEYIGYL